MTHQISASSILTRQAEQKRELAEVLRNFATRQRIAAAELDDQADRLIHSAEHMDQMAAVERKQEETHVH